MSAQNMPQAPDPLDGIAEEMAIYRPGKGG